ncbi:MAG: aminotransferase class V-fold PLP-dependent enzyme [Bacteriovoracales bacterium]|nr:aminotransferase class V-fold PLP-dependent enzyme [Bacteriovoracales bacterium]
MKKEQDIHGLEMSSELMLDLARQAAELTVERIKGLSKEGVWEGEFRQVLEEQWSREVPERGKSAQEVLKLVANKILPLALRLDHPRCFGFVPSSPTWPGVLADFITAGHHVNQCTWLTSSGPSQVELIVIDWFRRWIGYPKSAGGLFTSGGSAASVDALVAAREAAGHPERGAVYISDQGHSSLARSAMVIGIRPEGIRKVPTDRYFRLDLQALKDMVARDRTAGLNPIAICANAGSTSTGAIDPLGEIANYCQDEGIWFHVDAAYGGFAVIAEEGKKLLHKIEHADSIGLDAHKWFFQPYEAGCLMVKDIKTLEGPFGVRPNFLQDTVWGDKHPNFSDRGLQLSRSFRALKVWMSVQTFGMAAFRQAISNAMKFTAQAEQYIDKSPTLELLTPSSLGIVCFRVNSKDSPLSEEELTELNSKVLTHIFWDGSAFLTSTTLREKFSLRLCIINHNTTWNNVRKTLQAIEKFGRESFKN